jgi:hypothetical protein
MPRIGEVNLAQILAEVSPVLDRVDTVEQAIAECGAAPVTRASGKTKAVGFRWAANRRARTALHAFADNSRHASPWAAKPYADARRRGKHHPHAIRILARAWLRVMWACCTPTPPTTRPATAPNTASPPELDPGNSSAPLPVSCTGYWSALEPGGRLVRNLCHVVKSGVAVAYCERPVGR